jgi:hypothetical protein
VRERLASLTAEEQVRLLFLLDQESVPTRRGAKPSNPVSERAWNDLAFHLTHQVPTQKVAANLKPCEFCCAVITALGGCRCLCMHCTALERLETYRVFFIQTNAQKIGKRTKPVMAQSLKSRLGNRFVPIVLETDMPTGQPTLLRTSGLFTVDFGDVQPRSA